MNDEPVTGIPFGVVIDSADGEWVPLHVEFRGYNADDGIAIFDAVVGFVHRGDRPRVGILPPRTSVEFFFTPDDPPHYGTYLDAYLGGDPR
ncbi:hypothetical protein [Gordonia iterans]